MNDQLIAQITMGAVKSLLAHMPSQEARSSALSALLMLSYKLLRTVESDEFVRGWLEAALEEVKTAPPDITLRKPH